MHTQLVFKYYLIKTWQSRNLLNSYCTLKEHTIVAEVPTLLIMKERGQDVECGNCTVELVPVFVKSDSPHSLGNVSL